MRGAPTRKSYPAKAARTRVLFQLSPVSLETDICLRLEPEMFFIGLKLFGARRPQFPDAAGPKELLPPHTSPEIFESQLRAVMRLSLSTALSIRSKGKRPHLWEEAAESAWLGCLHLVCCRPWPPEPWGALPTCWMSLGAGS